MRYRDVITRSGVLDDAMASTGRRIGGVPGFLFREWAKHAVRWMTTAGSGRYDLAFFDE